jgi:hypothetical protein
MGLEVLEKLFLVKELGLTNLAAELEVGVHEACAQLVPQEMGLQIYCS